MLIKTLVENTSISEEFGSEHGLSLYIETKRHKILFDTGASALFAENARKMDVNLKEVDIAILSHGHYDHGGGLATFLKINTQAKVFLNQNAFGKYYANRKNVGQKYIGLDESLMSNDRFVFVGENDVIDEELELFSNVKGQRYRPSGNKDLFKMIGDSYINDDFSHEQNLIVKEADKTVLVAGCAHNGIVNILDHFQTQKGCFPCVVIGGFHLYNRSNNQSEDPEIVTEIGQCLIRTNAKFFTCHCTGLESYHCLKEVMGEKIDYLSTGTKRMI